MAAERGKPFPQPRHCCARNHRTESQAEEGIQNAGRDRYSNGVVYERKEQVLPNIPHRGLTETPRARDTAQIPAHQRYTSALDRDVRSRSHRDAHICLSKRRGIVYTVTGHGYFASSHLQTPDDV